MNEVMWLPADVWSLKRLETSAGYYLHIQINIINRPVEFCIKKLSQIIFYYYLFDSYQDALISHWGRQKNELDVKESRGQRSQWRYNPGKIPAEQMVDLSCEKCNSECFTQYKEAKRVRKLHKKMINDWFCWDRDEFSPRWCFVTEAAEIWCWLVSAHRVWAMLFNCVFF